MSTVIAFDRSRSRVEAPVRQVRSGSARAALRVVESPKPHGGARSAPIRLTRRGQLVAGLLAVLLVLVVAGGAVLLLGRPALAGDTQQSVVPASYRVVLPGETLWSIAHDVAPNRDPRDTVDDIVEYNALSSVGVQTGQRIAIPGDLTGH